MKSLITYSMLAMLCLLQVPPAQAADKKMTTYERQINLMKRINEGQKTKQLTVKQAKGLRKDLSKIATSKQKIRDDKLGKNHKEKTENVEERLTETSEKIEKLKKDNIEDKD